MAESLTRKELEAQTERLGRRLDRNLVLNTWAPGDGWTRYSVSDADTFLIVIGNRQALNKKEFQAALTSADDVLDAIKYPL